VLRTEAPPLVSDPNEMQTQVLLDQLEDFIVELGTTQTCSIIYVLKATQRLTGKELTSLKVAKALAAAAPKLAGPSAVAKRGRTGGPTSQGTRTPTTQPSLSQQQLFTAPESQAAAAAPSTATADHLPIVRSLTPDQWE